MWLYGCICFCCKFIHRLVPFCLAMETQMVALLQCPHVACRECLQTYFTIQIREHNISELRCPFCREPDLADEKIEQNYFSNMSVLVSFL